MLLGLGRRYVGVLPTPGVQGELAVGLGMKATLLGMPYLLQLILIHKARMCQLCDPVIGSDAVGWDGGREG